MCGIFNFGNDHLKSIAFFSALAPFFVVDTASPIADFVFFAILFSDFDNGFSAPSTTFFTAAAPLTPNFLHAALYVACAFSSFFCALAVAFAIFSSVAAFLSFSSDVASSFAFFWRSLYREVYLFNSSSVMEFKAFTCCRPLTPISCMVLNNVVFPILDCRVLICLRHSSMASTCVCIPTSRSLLDTVSPAL